MKIILISILIIVILILIIITISAYFIRQRNKEIDLLFSEIEQIKNYLIID